jgi:hypothetical protein
VPCGSVPSVTGGVEDGETNGPDWRVCNSVKEKPKCFFVTPTGAVLPSSGSPSPMSLGLIIVHCPNNPNDPGQAQYILY